MRPETVFRNGSHSAAAPIRVLVVDDSAFMRRRLTEILEEDPHLCVADAAANGAEAVRKVGRIRPDVVLMDVEMPVMDGIEAVRRIMRQHPVPILMFSALTHAGARATLDALEAGAVDFLPKRLEDIHSDQGTAKLILRQRIRTVVRRRPIRESAPKMQGDVPVALGRPGMVVIAASTGGPVALQKVLAALPQRTPFPLLLVQHMPANFTPGFAERLDQTARIQVREAVDGDRLRPGTALLAPGGMQMALDGGGRIHLRKPAEGEIYRPSADVTFASVAEHFRGRVLAVVLTGMGADGCAGARRLKARGAKVWAQDEASCVVYGMPRAVAEAGLADRVLPLNRIVAAFGGG
ncbi:two-component system, chemotaxis family, protein-glutamate methylesterase/glutaminase [Methylomarinovum caldicuralii]|uniref:Protein-glutamate methylesterase/protein-glutamine glutaminase n=1 Tax=Methylomarinovum caldicuralii TaxID=438856 RepID=A0AAU9BSP9_9GAMM|nr:chemotaxis response regulator protein-glutamate methylesterase [Methylomarinovum caldicuralii]BCX81596.1 two-component system, chemotaxis family, protein-glutamate methylesterase/glutaminase [Methylomarinovum caldicuralii]